MDPSHPHSRSIPTPIRSRRTRTARLPSLDIKTITFALSLCLPYVGSTPLPDPRSTHSLLTSVEIDNMSSSNIRNSLADTFRPAVQHLASILTRREGGHDPPILAVAALDQDGKWVIPPGYVILVQKMKPGIIVLSYIIAFVGSLCTLELLVRRTNNAGWRNRLLLTAAGICFGGVSTFAMHFVFNNALSLHHPHQDMRNYPSLYLQYDPGFTVLSLVASITAMTLAFFIMGTDIHDWCFLPGRRRQRIEKRKRHGGDEYGRWKKTHNRVSKQGSESGLGFGIGSLIDTAGRVAGWSLVDTGERRTWSSIGKKGDKGILDRSEWDSYGDGVTMKRDKELDEMEFRLGKGAVRAELERRRAPTPTSMADPSLDLHTHGPAMLDAPQPVYRRGSLPTDQINGGYETSSSRLDMSSRNLEANDSTTGLLSGDPWASIDSGFEPYRRRASLPTASLAIRPEQNLRPPATLARIQSLPEPDHDADMSAKNSESGPRSPNLSIKANLTTLDVHEPVPQIRRKTKTRRAFSKIETFLGFDVVTTTDIIKVLITGTVAGFGVAGMHYIGQASITGMPYIAYRPEFIVGSVIIASSAVCIALYIMFIMLRPKLKHTLWSKLAVAFILAAAVCLMHFTGMRGTVYGWPRDQPISRTSQLTGTNAAIVGVVTALAFAACVGCAVFFAVSSWSKRRERRRRRRVVIAAVFLDQYDRILVNSTDGMLPMCDIASLIGDQHPGSKKSYSTSSTDSSALGMDLTAGHDAFVSALKMSWSWRSGLNPNPNTLTQEAINGQVAMNSAVADIRRGSQYTMGSSVNAQDSRPVRLSIAKFLEMFGNAAGQLAVRVTGQNEGIMRLGVLYDQILTTGWVKLSNSNDTVSKGQLVFLVRRVSSAEEQSDLLARHHIFADPTAVAQTIHKSLAVPFEHTQPLLKDISLWCDSMTYTTLKPNTLYSGIAVVQATPFDGLRILLEQSNRAQLPMRELCWFNSAPLQTTSDELSGTVEEIGEALTWLEGMNLLSVITRNMTIGDDFIGGPLVGKLLSALERAIIPMLDSMLTAEDMSHILPRLTLHPMLVPLTPGSNAKARQSGFTPPYLIVFYANYDAAVNTFTDKWLPFSLFRAQNACVMAGNIASAAKYDNVLTPPTRALVPNTADRRPSKVQFEGINPSGNGSISTHASIMTAPPLPETQPTTGLFTGLATYSFPPRSPTEIGGDTASSIPAHVAARLGKPSLARGGSRDTIPRRSSLARTSRFDQPSGDDGEKEKEKAARQGEVGVGDWDPDWLLVLLRNKLRADT